MKLLEKDMEYLIIANPQKYLKEPDLKLISRQYSIGNYRFDLLFEDRHHGKLIVEIQRGTLDRNHTYKVLDYFDEYKKNNPCNYIELMIVANKITRERRDRLKSYGIAFFEIPEAIFLEDPNWVSKKHNTKHEKPSSKNYSKGKEIFNNLIARKAWKEECAKLTELTTHRKNQLNQIFIETNGIVIPFSYFTQERINTDTLRNSHIFPIICAFHIGYFTIENDSIYLKPEYHENFKEISHNENGMEELIKISEDSPTEKSLKPEKEGTVEYIKFEVLIDNPYKYTAKEFFEEVHFNRRGKKHLKIETYSLKRLGLAKRYGWGIHINSAKKIAIIPCESKRYATLLKDPNVKKSNAYRSKKKEI